MTMEDKVKEAQFIFIGEAGRIYFVDKNHNEIGRPARELGFAAAAIDVRIIRILFPANATLTEMVSIDIASGDRVIEQQRSEYLGKPMIYFTKAQKITYIFDEQDKVVSRQQSIVRHYRPPVRALRGPTANPLPLNHFDDVISAIEKLQTLKQN